MRYMGGKSRISNEISNILNKFTEGKTFVSLFCGTCAIESKVTATKKICNDLHPYLIELLTAVQKGYELPDAVTKEDYFKVRENKDEDKALTGFVGFGCSFGGKWFGGYSNNNSKNNYTKQSKNSLLRKMKTLTPETTIFTNLSYKDVTIPVDSVVYCDPPYQRTTKYSNSKDFNHDEFWDYVRELSKEHMVFVSEINAPLDFTVVWNKSMKRTLRVDNENSFSSVEKLFVHDSNANKYIDVIENKAHDKK